MDVFKKRSSLFGFCEKIIGYHQLPIIIAKPNIAEETKRGCKSIFIIRAKVKPRRKYRKGKFRNVVKNFFLKFCQKIKMESMAGIDASLKSV